MRTQLFSSLFLLVIAGCAPTLANRGTVIDPEKVATIKIGTSNRDSVLNTLGTPSARGSFDDNTWYYIGRHTQQYSFLDPEVTDQQIITIKYNDEGLVQTVETTGKEAITDVKAASGETPSFGHETTWLQDLFGNIGRAGVPLGKQK